MKAFNWPQLFNSHPIFSSLNQEDLTQLLKEKTSQERKYAAGDVVVREGEVGDSLFLIGSGSVQVTRQGSGGQSIALATLSATEFFGEVAVLERRPRSATVIAKENCLLLEIAGEKFRTLLEMHPDLHAKVHAKMSARLGQANRQ
jgi:CRP-like cAMP-binding protein